MTLGAKGYVGYGIESVEGTAVAPTRFIPVNSFDFEENDDDMILDQVRQSRFRYIALPAPFSVSGSMEMELILADTLPLLASAFSAATETSSYGGGGYQHTFTPGDDTGTFTFEESKAGIVVMRRAGIRVNTLEIKAAFGEPVTSTWGLEGLSYTKESAETEGVTFSDVVPLHFTGSSVKLDDTEVADFKDFTFSVDNGDDRIGTNRKTRAWRRMARGMMGVEFGGTLDFVSDAEYVRFLAAEWFDVELHFEGGTIGAGPNKETLVITVPKVKWRKIGSPLSAADFIEQAVEATIVAPTNSIPFTAVVINGESESAAGLA